MNLLNLVFEVSIFCREYLWVGFLMFFMMSPVFVLRRVKFIQPDENNDF